MVALAERLRLELDSSDRKNLVGSQIIPDKSGYRANPLPLAPFRKTINWAIRGCYFGGHVICPPRR
jgi:hypothetical protein